MASNVNTRVNSSCANTHLVAPDSWPAATSSTACCSCCVSTRAWSDSCGSATAACGRRFDTAVLRTRCPADATVDVEAARPLAAAAAPALLAPPAVAALATALGRAVPAVGADAEAALLEDPAG